MNESDRHLLQQLKREADEILFADLHFDSRLKERVLRQTASKRERPFFEKWFRLGRFRWIYGSAAAAVIAAVLLLSSPAFRDGASLNNDPPRTFSETGDDAGVQSWPLQTPDEARASFGDGLRVPAYLPDDLPLSGIFAHGTRKTEADRVTFSYIYGDKSLLVIEDRDTSTIGFHSYDRIKIHGAQGYLKSSAQDTELHWISEGVHYAVMGTISGPEAMKVAESMK